MPKIVGDYKIIKTLGEGNFSKVKKVVNIKNDKLYAMKIINLSEIKDKLSENQINHRIEVMSNMSHPGIVKLRAILRSKNNIFLVFDLAEGELFNSLAQGSPLPEDTARRYFQQLIDIISYMHKNDASHRDIKSENLLVDSGDNLRITDFICSNISKKSDEEVDDIDKNKINPIKAQLRYYTAPEVFHENGYISPAADVWSAGVILFMMLTGELPFDGSTPEELEQNIKTCKVDYPPKFPPKVQQLLKNIFLLEPEKRFTITEIKKTPWFKEKYTPVTGKTRKKKPFESDVTVHYTADTKSHHKSNENEENEEVNVFELIARMSGISIDGLVNPSVPIKSMTSFTSNQTIEQLIQTSNKQLLGFGARVKDNKNSKIIKALIPICSKEVYIRIEFTKITDDLSLVEIDRMKGGQIEFLRVFKLLKNSMAEGIMN
ncbi:hypothetical protein M9Y10_015964 [Tritrichomonas musculus]|uniref:non-specific serine/threonine protein kinase n=1 Tax=Tritrichomonas musculus TaxID=1915356 RepID=A0ABR2I656_9EUKA